MVNAEYDAAAAGETSYASVWFVLTYDDAGYSSGGDLWDYAWAG